MEQAAPFALSARTSLPFAAAETRLRELLAREGDGPGLLGAVQPALAELGASASLRLRAVLEALEAEAPA